MAIEGFKINVGLIVKDPTPTIEQSEDGVWYNNQRGAWIEEMTDQSV